MIDPTTALHAAAVTPAALVASYGMVRHGRRTLARRDGFAPSLTVARRVSERAARRAGKVTRPTLLRRHTRRSGDFGRHLGYTVRPEGGRSVYVTWEDFLLLVAPPRMGKTGRIGHEVIDAPGPAVVTSTKLDIHEITAGLRARRGPVWRLNPENMGELGSTLRWSPIPLCADPGTAIQVAAYMVAAASTGAGIQDESFWENKNAQVLRALLYAAAVGGRTMVDVAAWVTNPSDKTPLRILEEHPATPAGWVQALWQLMSTGAEKTRDSVYLTLGLTVEFMADPQVAEIALPGPGDEPFDIDAFLESRGTLYLLGSAKPYGGMGPLFAALTGLIFERAKLTSQQRPGGRLDPPLSLILDEATNICPVPLPQWCADAGGRGIALTAAVQSPSQLEERWGRPGRDTIAQAACWVILGALTVEADLDALSAMFGEKDEPTPRPLTPKGREHAAITRRVPVLAPAEIRQIKDGHAVLAWRNERPIEVRQRPAWQRRDVRREQCKHAREQASALASEHPAPSPYPADPHDTHGDAGPPPPAGNVVTLPRRGGSENPR